MALKLCAYLKRPALTLNVSQVIVSALISSIPALRDVMLLMTIYLAIFGTMGVLLIGGQLRNRCADPDFSAAFTDASGAVQVSRRLSCTITPTDQNACRGGQCSERHPSTSGRRPILRWKRALDI